MALWIETKIRYNKKAENGEVKKVTEPYLVDALSCTEAEARTIEEMTPYITGEFSVSAVKKSNVSEIFRDEKGDRWYKVVVAFITVDEKTGCEKRSNSHMMVQASSFENALDNFLDGMKDTMADFEIVSISETKIIDVFDAKMKI